MYSTAIEESISVTAYPRREVFGRGWFESAMALPMSAGAGMSLF